MRLIVVTPYPFVPSVSGGRIRNRHLIQGLLDRGHAVEQWIVAPRGETQPPWPSSVGPKVRWFAARDRSGARAKLSSLGSRYPEAAWQCPPVSVSRDDVRGVDAAILCQAHVGRFMAPFERLGIPVVLNEQNVETDLTDQLARISPTRLSRARLRLDVRKFGRFEADLVGRAALVTAVSEVDAGKLRAMAPAARIEVLPSGADVERIVPSEHGDSHGDRLVLLGTLGYLPNLDAASWLVRDILPLVQARRPHAHVALVGSSPPSAIERLAGPSVEVIGPVDDIAAELAASDVFVAPLRAGSGVRIKLLDAFAHGIPVVATSLAAEGLDVVDGVHLSIADDAASFATAVAALLEDPALRARYSTAARRLVEERYDWREISGRFESMLASLGRPSANTVSATTT